MGKLLALVLLLAPLAAGCAEGQGSTDGGRRVVPDGSMPADATSERPVRPPGSDASAPDASAPDASAPDASAPDASSPDAGRDAGPACPGGCDDGVACTVDRCEGGSCVHRRDDGLCGPGELCDPDAGCVEAPDCTSDTQCDNGAFCDGAERCQDGRCVSGTPPCSGSTPRCDESLDRCVACLEHAHCDDGLACTGQERCVEGVCVSGTPVSCDDGLACTADRCVEPTGSCEHVGPDMDRDGVVAAGCGSGEDCDDSDPDVRPGAPERCNLADDDCDGQCDEGAGCRVGVHRSFRDSPRDHFYTTDRAEAACCGYTVQAENYFYLYRTEQPGTVPLYRCYSERNRDHFYTVASNCEGASSYVREGALGYIRRRARGATCGAVPLYRLWNMALRDHAYTISEAERDRLVREGYRLETSPGFVWTSP